MAFNRSKAARPACYRIPQWRMAFSRSKAAKPACYHIPAIKQWHLKGQKQPACPVRLLTVRILQFLPGKQ